MRQISAESHLKPDVGVVNKLLRAKFVGSIETDKMRSLTSLFRYNKVSASQNPCDQTLRARSVSMSCFGATNLLELPDILHLP